MELIERYNALLKDTEDDTISRLNSVLDASFNRLIRRTRWHLRYAYIDPAQRNLLILQELRQLVPLTSPGKEDRYDQTLTRLLTQASAKGIAVASELTTNLNLPNRVDVSIPLEATKVAVEQAKGYLRRHGNTFAETAAMTVAQGVAEGRPLDSTVRDMQRRLNVVKSRAENIVRTESLRAYNTASDRYYSVNNVEQVMYYATADDRTCPICVSRAANIYKRGDVAVPLHPRCRCYLAPWSDDTANMDESYVAMRKAHKRDVDAEAQRLDPSQRLNKAALFEQIAPVPVP